MDHIPFRVRFEPKDATQIAVPLVSSSHLSESADFGDVVKEIPIVLELVRPLPPIRRTGDNEIDRFLGQTVDQIEGVARKN